jgi:RNA polymerase sigma factor (TIGR02999 family)
MRTTGLVHEAFLALQKTGALGSGRGAGAFAEASPDLYVRAMRRALIDAARRRGRAKRGGGVRPLSLSDRDVPASGAGRGVEDRVHLAVDLDAALDRLKRVDARACRVVELKFYGGLEDSQISEALGVTTRTVRRDWAKAQAHLRLYVGEREQADISRSRAA